MSTPLGIHATAELTYQGVDETTKGNMVSIVGYFAEWSDTDRPAVIEQILALLRFEVLSPLTNDPAEWTLRDDTIPGQKIWQSKRWPVAWSYAEDHSNYFLISQHDPAGFANGTVYPTIPAPSP